MAKHMQLVVFTVGRELYGVSIEAVHEIVRVPDITEMPEAQASLEGVINLRGKIIPVIDLRKRLSMPRGQRTKSTRILIMEQGRGMTGLLVDSVLEVLKVEPEAVEAPPEIISALGIEYITGVIKSGTRLIILIRLEKVMSVDDMRKIHQEALQSAAA